MSEARRLLDRAGVETRLNDAGMVGHSLNAEVIRSLRQDWTWLVRGQDGWSRSSERILARTDAVRSEAPSPVEVKEEEVAGDLPAFFLHGQTPSRLGMVFLSGACTHPQGYIQAFQFAAHEKGSILGPQGDVCCGGAFRRWTLDPARQNDRIEAGYEAAGEGDRLKDMVLIGYSQGALLAELLADRYPGRYTRVILIGAPTEPSPSRLRHVRAAVMISGQYDATERMKAGARALEAAGIPTRYLEMPKARHGQMADAEHVMGEALEWVTAQGG
jgi:hypothetical protein